MTRVQMKAELDSSIAMELDSSEAKDPYQAREKHLGGLRTMPFILGNEICQRLASIGQTLNMISYLMGQYHMNQVAAATLLNIVSGTSSLMQLVGAFLSDVYLGRFWTILIASCFNLLGLIFLTITAINNSLRPTGNRPASPGQRAFLYSAFFLIIIATGGIKPCSYAFGADQFKQDSLEEKKIMQSFFNWYFFFQYVSSLMGDTVLVYVQDNVGWGWGFGIPTILLLLSMTIFLLGNNYYRHVRPEGSPFTGLAQVAVASFHKRELNLPSNSDELYQVQAEDSKRNLCHTPQFRFLDHAAIKTPGDLKGSVRNPWRLCTLNQVEELKAIIRLGPIWFMYLLSATALSEHGSFTIPQAKTMDRHLGGSFEIPAASIIVFAPITVILFLPIYDRLFVPTARRYTGNHRGIKLLQRVGAGIFMSIVALTVAGLVESKRRSFARRAGFVDKPHTPIAFSVFWLVPQYFLFGLAESLYTIGQLEFLYDQLPENMRSMAGALYWCCSGIGKYSGSVILQVVHKVSGRQGRRSWLENNLNRGHLNYFYFLLAGLQFVNFVLFLKVSTWYKYKGQEAHASCEDITVSTWYKYKGEMGEGEAEVEAERYELELVNDKDRKA